MKHFLVGLILALGLLVGPGHASAASQPANHQPLVGSVARTDPALANVIFPDDVPRSTLAVVGGAILVLGFVEARRG